MNILVRIMISIMMGLTAITAGCDSGGNQPLPLSTAVPARSTDAQLLAQGRQIYLSRCARCHGNDAQGAGDWRIKGPDGRFPPPPLDGSGHAWHHPTSVLVDVIKSGSPGGAGNMPAFGDTLSEQEIMAIVAWFQSTWSDEVYQAWVPIEQRSRQRGASK